MRGRGARDDANCSGSRPSRQVVLDVQSLTTLTPSRMRLQITSLTKFCEVHVYGASETSSVIDGPCDYERNIDFAENDNLDNYCKIQSAYLASTTYSLLVSVWSWLSAEGWKSETLELQVGSEVTVSGEKAHETINPEASQGFQFP